MIGDSHLFDSIKTGKPNETAEQAINRVNRFFELLTSVQTLDDDSIYLFKNNHQPYCIRQVSTQELDEQERALGVKLPPSYRNFVLKKGLMAFGQANDDERRMLLPLRRLTDTVQENWDADPETDFDPNEKQHLNNLIAFSFGDEQLQITWYHCLDFNSLNPDTGEVSVIDFDQDELYYIGKKHSPRCETNGFDIHIKSIVNSVIAEVLSSLE